MAYNKKLFSRSLCKGKNWYAHETGKANSQEEEAAPGHCISEKQPP